MSATTEQALRMLRDLRAATSDIEAAAVVSPDGFIIASLLPADVEEERMAAISAAMLALGVKTSADLRKGTLHQVFIRSEDGCVTVMNAGGEAVLSVMSRQNSHLGLLFMEMRRTAAQIGSLLSQSPDPSS
jgi:predicted regulator of Ras-like GTPase activity (Roadblock/LC7/MglB family)